MLPALHSMRFPCSKSRIRPNILRGWHGIGTVNATPPGFIPTEWYPSAFAIAGNDLLIATAKGESSGPNNMQGTLKGERKRKEHPYIPTLIGGSIQRISLSDIEKNLAAYTRQVEDDNLIRSNGGKLEFAGGTNPIRHVIYILKENRTYDQIFGDLPAGDGDPSLTMYGKDITPNEHKLALQFGVLDNFYDSGEVSGDGHIWSTAATTSDYNEKTWPIGYRSKERTYDSGGAVAEEFPLEQGIPDVDDPGTGFIWDNLARRAILSHLRRIHSRRMVQERKSRFVRCKARRLQFRNVSQCRNQERRTLCRRMSAIRAAARARGPGRFRR